MKIVLASNTYRKFDTCVELIKSAYRGSRKPDATLIVDNSSGLFPKYLDEYSIDPATDLHDARIAVFPFNAGCAIAWNWIIKMVRQNDPDAYVIISNDDIQFHEDTLEKFEKAALEYPDELIYVCGGIASPNAFSLFMVHPQSLIDKVGLFDEEFKYPYSEDSDMYRRLRIAGYDLYRVPECSVDHIGSATLRTFDEIETQQHHMRHARNMEYLILKWGLPDHNRIELEYDGVQNGYLVPFNGNEDDRALALSYLHSRYGY